jgi:hypothetical protein
MYMFSEFDTIENVMVRTSYDDLRMGFGAV